MNGQSDAKGKVLQSEAQQIQLMELTTQYANQLWLVVGHRAHRLYFNVISEASHEDVKDYCAQDTMGFHRAFNNISRQIIPGEQFKQCISDTGHGYSDLDGSGIAVPYRNFARELRQKAWRKWMGSAVGECAEALDKPALPASWEKIQELALDNADLYEMGFKNIPRNEYLPDKSGENNNEKEKQNNLINTSPSVWSVLSVNSSELIQGTLGMPFSAQYWLKYENDGRKENFFMKKIKGYFTSLPKLWTESENNLIPYNIRLIANHTHSDGLEMQMANNVNQSRNGVV